MNNPDLKSLLGQFGRGKIGVIGDFCLDAYWSLSQGERELSIETGRATHAVIEQRYALGGAANIVANLAALRVGVIKAFTVLGNDLFGAELMAQLRKLNVDCSGVVVQQDDWDTAVYAKPYLGDEELERIDFGRFNRITPAAECALIAQVQQAVDDLDVLILNRQLPYGICSGAVYDTLAAGVSSAPGCRFVLDFRELPERFDNMIVKTNTAEAARFCGEEREAIGTVDDVERYAAQIYKQSRQPVIITRGRRGMAAFNGENFHHVPGVHILKQVDPVGAGDTTVAALAACLAAGASIVEAAHVANLAASVTVQKIRQTGTASPEEIIQAGTDTDYIYRPELAEDQRRARFWGSSQIEIVNLDVHFGDIQHAVFDHDGTISVLREGWEAIMEPVMVRAILGKQADCVSQDKYQQVVSHVRDYIDQSTGIQTILQMQALTEMVREFGYVPENDILDAKGYKALYNDALMVGINARKQRIESHELDVTDFTIKGAVDLLHALHRRGVKLYLISGTDEADVRTEAELLGYAHLFEGRIFGAVGEIRTESKKVVLERIMQENNLRGRQLITFGDGPVEMRETKKQGGIAVGVVSDEVRRYGRNLQKRTRLIQAGADLIIPDYTQLPILLRLILNEASTDDAP